MHQPLEVSALRRFRIHRNHLVRPHHVVVFMLQHVAMEDISTGITFKSNKDGKDVARIYHCCVLPTRLVLVRVAV